jgi:hypothetical protein
MHRHRILHTFQLRIDRDEELAKRIVQLARKQPTVQGGKEGRGDVLEQLVGEGTHEGVAGRGVAVDEVDEGAAVGFWGVKLDSIFD